MVVGAGHPFCSASPFIYPLSLQRKNPSTAVGAGYARLVSTYDGPVVMTLRQMETRPALASIMEHLRAHYRPIEIRKPCAEVDIWLRERG